MKHSHLLDYIAIPPNKESTVYLLLKLESFAIESAERKNLNLSLILDRSGSMAGTKLDYTKKASRSLVDHLVGKDIFSLVIYDDTVQTLISPQQAKNKNNIRRTIDSIYSGGMTNLSGGWLEGLGHIDKFLDKEKINRALLLTDGLANQGIVEHDKLKEIAGKWREKGISTTTLGFGSGFNEDLLAGMADAGGGSFYFIENPDDAPKVFKEELGDLTTLVAQNMKVTAHCDSTVSIHKQLNEYPKIDLTTWDFGDMFADEFKSMLFELKIQPQPAGETKIMDITINYDQIYPQVEKKSITFAVNIVVDEKKAADCGRDEEVIQEYMLLESALQKQKAIDYADQGDYARSIACFKDMSAMLASSPCATPQMQAEQCELDEYVREMEEKSYSPGLRKKAMYKKFAAQRSKEVYKKKK
ncbi:vWA domain-containing protein [Candidatus Uabimicrobium amorphum]|uniref:VWFA domain-containing protein n=1 Tax=Uabimicrobium amorphum TaxID=2596890 RepID=A0A5S9F3G8_UABAM|nr:VWA domain-containing protein [Candidatus Uabimicrobium amorphum]BBM84666.1 hypothetical protein UABAM_03027 [Candidatus Uabimicrobium amorphum]